MLLRYTQRISVTGSLGMPTALTCRVSAQLQFACNFRMTHGGRRLAQLTHWVWINGGSRNRWRTGPPSRPARAFRVTSLREHEERRLLRVLNAPEHRNLSPLQVIPALAEQGTYIASEATAHRVLHKYNK